MVVNNTLCELAQDDYGIRFDEMPSECCRLTHVEPFKADVHLFGYECQENINAIVYIALITFALKIGQNFLGARMGQLERELMHMEKSERKCFGKLGELVGLEIIAGIIGVVSILFITGNNFYIWVTVVVSNAFGVMLSLCLTRPDHHSPAAELEALLKNAQKDKTTEETIRAYKALKELKCVLNKISLDTVYVVDAVACNKEDPLRKRLVL